MVVKSTNFSFDFLYIYNMNLRRSLLAKNILFILLLLVVSLPLFAQIDKEFWFVGPEASSNHGDRPVYIRISTMELPANINLRMPANNKFVPVVSAMAANSTISIRLDLIAGDNTWLDSIENRPADRVLRKGLLLTSDNYVTAYYEINNTSNPAIFPLKGKNGVGTEFFISGQTDYANQTNDGSEAFDIVATEDATLITITPAIDIVGHSANIPFQIMLNKGETYSARTLITSSAESLAGSHVVSDKPIAITISDDSIITGGWDIIGDQIVPVNLLGWKYIAIKGFANNAAGNNDERVYITATQDATDIMMDGNPVPVATINAGEQYDYPIPAASNTACINSSKPVCVYHLSGHPGEAGASILPQDSCTGSRKIGFNRSSASAFALLILTRSGNEGSFQLNGNPGIIIAPNFNVVPGTGGNWMYYRQNNLSTAQVPLGANLLENSNGKFHLGILNNVGASSEYGYFSDFSTLYLGADASICPGDSMILDGGPYRISYDWRKLLAGVWTNVGNTQTYIAKDTGYYSCITDGDFCLLMDTIHIGYYPNGTVNLGADRIICQGTSTTFNPGNYVTYEWSTGEITPTLTTNQQGPVWVKVTNNNGCIAHDTVMVYVDSLPLANHPVNGLSTVCQGQNNVIYTIDPLQYAASYSWTLPPGATGTSTTNSVTLDYATSATTGTLIVHGLNPCGNGPDITMAVTVDPLPSAAGLITGPPEVCQGQQGVVFSVPVIANATSYIWNLPPGCTIVSGAGTTNILVNVSLNAASGIVSASGSNNCGTGVAYSIPLLINLFPQPAGIINGPPVVCQGQQGAVYNIPLVTGADSYQWILPPGAYITAGLGTNTVTLSFDSTALSGNLTVCGHSVDCGNGIPSTFMLTVNPIPVPAGIVSGPAVLCQGQANIAYSVPAITNATSYIWTIPAGCSIQSGAGTNMIGTTFNTSAVSGTITVRGDNAACGMGRRSGINLTVNPLPLSTGSILGTTPVCQGEPAVSYAVQNVDPLTTSWLWSLVPANAGAISGNTAAIGINWNEAFTGTASLLVNGVNGCGNGPVSPAFSVLIKARPDVSYADCGDLATTKNAQPILLKGGHPIGPAGVYTGTGVSGVSPGNYVFDPSGSAVVPSPGGTPYLITYRYTNMNNCFREATKVIKVFPSNALQPCPGTVTDVRDGKTYGTFMSGFGALARCWMTENLNFGEFSDGVMPQTDNCIAEKYCIDNVATQCNHAGGNYQWDELMNYVSSAGTHGLCPPGWHVPSEADWDLLISDYQGEGLAGGFLKYSGSSSGFQGFTAGVRYLSQSWCFTDTPVSSSIFWTSHISAPGTVLSYGINSINPSVSRYNSSKANALSVRCVRD